MSGCQVPWVSADALALTLLWGLYPSLGTELGSIPCLILFYFCDLILQLTNQKRRSAETARMPQVQGK